MPTKGKDHHQSPSFHSQSKLIELRSINEVATLKLRKIKSKHFHAQLEGPKDKGGEFQSQPTRLRLNHDSTSSSDHRVFKIIAYLSFFFFNGEKGICWCGHGSSPLSISLHIFDSNLSICWKLLFMRPFA